MLSLPGVSWTHSSNMCWPRLPKITEQKALGLAEVAEKHTDDYNRCDKGVGGD